MANYIEDNFGTCPYCNRSIHATYNKVLNLSYRIDLSDKIHDKSLNMAKCIFCENEFRYETEIFAFDFAKRFAIIVNTDEAMSGYEHLKSSIYDMAFDGGYKLRFVNTCLELMEKILIFNLGLDDRQIEIVKQTHFPDIMENIQKHHRFLLTDVSDTLLLFTLYDEHDRIVSEVKIANPLPNALSLPKEQTSGSFAEFKKIDNKWAKEYLNGGKNNE